MMEIANTMLSSELQVFLNYVYEYKKGVRNMVLCTLCRRYRAPPPPPPLSGGSRGATRRSRHLPLRAVGQREQRQSVFRQAGMHCGGKAVYRAPAPSVVARGGFHPRGTAWLRHLPAVRAVLHAQEGGRRYGAVRRMKELTKCLFKPSRRGRRKRKASLFRDSPF